MKRRAWAAVRDDAPRMPWEAANTKLLDAHIFGAWARTHGTLSALRMWKCSEQLFDLLAAAEDTDGRIVDEHETTLAMAEWKNSLDAHDAREWSRFWGFARLVGGGMERRRIARDGHGNTMPTTLLRLHR